MENNFQTLPPNKRFKHLHQEKPAINLPAKKRPISTNLDSDTTPATTYCLPAKKRICALNPDLFPNKPFSPFDLNLEYDPRSDQIEKKVLENEEEQKEKEEADEDGIVCAICQSTDGDSLDPIVLCDGCDLMVHVTCYGKPLVNGVPDGDWFCCQCLAKDKENNIIDDVLSCCLCPVKGGALKPTNDGRWAHIVCALYVPEVFFEDPDGREGIDCSKVLEKRWGKKCYLCKKRDGCVVECSEQKCCLRFHVTCGLNEDLCIEYKEGRNKGAIVAGFCKTHTDLWKKQQATGKYKIVARNEE
ncbi:protein Jade-1 [Tanacetum coccineum]